MTVPGKPGVCSRTTGGRSTGAQKQLHNEFSPVSQVVLLNLTSHRKGSSPFLLLLFYCICYLTERAGMEGQSEFTLHTWLHPCGQDPGVVVVAPWSETQKGAALQGLPVNKGWVAIGFGGDQMRADHWCNQAEPCGTHPSPISSALAPL